MSVVHGPDAFTVASDINIDAYPSGAPDYAYTLGSGSNLTVNAANDRVQNGVGSTLLAARCIKSGMPTGDQECRASLNHPQAAGDDGGFLCVRMATNGSSHFYMTANNAPSVVLYRCDGGTGLVDLILLVSRSAGIAGTDYAMRLRAVGTGSAVHLWALPEGQGTPASPVTYTDTSVDRKTSGVPGFGIYGTSANAGYIDNFEISDLAATGFRSHSGVLTVGTGAANTVYSAVGLPFQPKAVILFWNGRSSDINANGEADIRQGFGFATSATDRRCVGSQRDHANAAIASDRVHRNDACVVSLDVAGAVNGLADFNGFTAYGFDLIIDQQFGAAMTVGFLALGGDSLTNVQTGQFQEPGATGNAAVTGVGFQPDCVLFCSAGITTAPNATAAEGHMMFGAAVSSSQRFVVVGGSDDAPGSSSSDTARYGIASECIALLTEAGTPITLDARADFVSMDADGFTLNWLERAGSRYVFYLALRGGRYRVDNFLSQTSLTTVSESGYEARPRGLLVLSACSGESTADTPVAHDELSVGAWGDVDDELASQLVLSVLDKDASGTQDCGTAIRYGACYLNQSTAATIAVEGDGAISALANDGFTFNQTDADPAQNMLFVVVFMDGSGTALSLSGLASAEAFGAAAIHLSIAPSSMESAEAVGGMQAHLHVAPAAMASQEQVGSLVAQTGVVTVVAIAMPSEEAFPGLTTHRVQPMQAIPSAEQFGTTMLNVGVLQVLPGSIGSAEALGTLTVLRGGVVAIPGGIASAQAFGVPVLTAVRIITPTGVGDGAALIEWNQNTEPDLAGYRVYWGTVSGVYTGVVDVGLTTTPAAPAYVLSNLTVGVVYFVSVTAYDTANNESGFGPEVSFTENGPRFGTTNVLGNVTVQPGGVASQQAFGTPVVIPGQVSLLPVGVASAQFFGTPALLPGGVLVVPVAIASAETLGLLVVTLGTVSLSPAAIASAEAFGTALVQFQDVTMTPPSIGPEEAFGGVLVSPGLVTIVPAGLSSLEALGALSVLRGAVSILPAGVASQESVNGPLLAFTALVAPVGIGNGGVLIEWNANTESDLAGYRVYWGTASGVYTGMVDVGLTQSPAAPAYVLGSLIPGVLYFFSVTAYDTANNESGFGPETTATPTGERFGTSVLSVQAVVRPSSIVSLEAVGLPVIVRGQVTVLATGILSGQAFGNQIVTAANDVVLGPVGVLSAETFGLSVVVPGLVLVQPVAIGTGEILGAPSVYGTLLLSPLSIASVAALGSPILQLGADRVLGAVGISTQELFGETALHRYIVASGLLSGEVIGVPVFQHHVQPTGILSQESAGLSTVLVGDALIRPVGIASQGVFGSALLLTLKASKAFRTFQAKARQFIFRK
jgi:hypothetical protein